MRVNLVLSAVIIFLAAATWPHSAFLPRALTGASIQVWLDSSPPHPNTLCPGPLLHLPPPHPRVRLVHFQILLGDPSCPEPPSLSQFLEQVPPATLWGATLHGLHPSCVGCLEGEEKDQPSL